MHTPHPSHLARLSSLLLFSMLVLISEAALGADSGQQEFRDVTIAYSAFNSSFIDPATARAYGITRSKRQGLVNIAVLPRGRLTEGGKPALVQGHVSNILGQRQTLEFFPIEEGKAVYYLAPFRFDNRDFLTFKISVQSDPNKPAHEISFQRTFYQDD
ncbi:MAG TPA: DUF4426 domain-containing protein [Porticoccaceae bacterium]|nr:DUF4426 domain-containing protein [Porticoccaceae bacterium]